jgi:hypothetical protein
MPTNFVAPANPVNKLTTETTFVIEREIGKRASLFVEYAGDYNVHGGPSYLFNSGGGYSITDTQQIGSASTTTRPPISSASAIRFASIIVVTA